jgi:NTE family protein
MRFLYSINIRNMHKHEKNIKRECLFLFVLKKAKPPAPSWRAIALRSCVGVALGLALSACQTLGSGPPGSTAHAPPQVPAQPPLGPIVVTPPVALPVAPVPTRPPHIGLALGGGAARGFAHIGVLQVLAEQGIKPDLIVGTSAGSLVATLYAAGKSPTELGALAQGMDESALTDWSFPVRGLIRGEALARYVRSQTAGLQIEQMRLPLGIVATDLADGQPILFRRGDPGAAVRASSAVPAVFQPVRIRGREYVDGGLVAPVPASFARQMGAELVVAVDISEAPDGQATGDAFRMLMQTFSIMGASINRWELKDADVVIRPRLVGMSGADFLSRQRAIQAGRDAAQAALPQLRARIAALTR